MQSPAICCPTYDPTGEFRVSESNLCFVGPIESAVCGPLGWLEATFVSEADVSCTSASPHIAMESMLVLCLKERRIVHGSRPSPCEWKILSSILRTGHSDAWRWTDGLTGHCTTLKILRGHIGWEGTIWRREWHASWRRACIAGALKGRDSARCVEPRRKATRWRRKPRWQRRHTTTTW